MPAIVSLVAWVGLTAWFFHFPHSMGGSLSSNLASVPGLGLAVWALLVYCGMVNPPRSVGRRAASFALVLSFLGLSFFAYYLDKPASPLFILGLPGLPGLLPGLWASSIFAELRSWDAELLAIWLSVGASPWVWFGVLFWLGRHFDAFRHRVLLLPATGTDSVDVAA